MLPTMKCTQTHPVGSPHTRHIIANCVKLKFSGVRWSPDCMQLIRFITIRSVVLELNHINRQALSLPYANVLETVPERTNKMVTRSIRSVSSLHGSTVHFGRARTMCRYRFSFTSELASHNQSTSPRRLSALSWWVLIHFKTDVHQFQY